LAKFSAISLEVVQRIHGLTNAFNSAYERAIQSSGLRGNIWGYQPQAADRILQCLLSMNLIAQLIGLLTSTEMVFAKDTDLIDLLRTDFFPYLLWHRFTLNSDTMFQSGILKLVQAGGSESSD